MKREVIITRDGSHTIAIPELKVMYHSIHGAIKESMHVYIQAGLQYACTQFSFTPLRIFEMGFGSGLNALLTAMEAQRQQIPVHYTSIEAYPLTAPEIAALNYGDLLGNQALFNQLLQEPWGRNVLVNAYFTLRKEQADLFSYTIDEPVHVIYYDAFAPAGQPEMWTKEIFDKLYSMLVLGGVLVTYCAKGYVRRAMQAAGFIVEKLQGPPGKREMLRATKSGPLSPEGGT